MSRRASRSLVQSIPKRSRHSSRARTFWESKRADGFQKGKEYFEQAIKIAPDYARGYVGLGAYYVAAADVFLSNQEAMPKGNELLATALRLDGTNGEAHLWLATITGILRLRLGCGTRENLVVQSSWRPGMPTPTAATE